MKLVAFVICGAENSINWWQIAAIWLFSVFACHFVALILPLPAHPIEVLVVLAASVKLSEMAGYFS